MQPQLQAKDKTSVRKNAEGSRNFTVECAKSTSKVRSHRFCWMRTGRELICQALHSQVPSAEESDSSRRMTIALQEHSGFFDWEEL